MLSVMPDLHNSLSPRSCKGSSTSYLTGLFKDWLIVCLLSPMTVICGLGTKFRMQMLHNWRMVPQATNDCINTMNNFGGWHKFICYGQSMVCWNWRPIILQARPASSFCLDEACRGDSAYRHISTYHIGCAAHAMVELHWINIVRKPVWYAELVQVRRCCLLCDNCTRERFCLPLQIVIVVELHWLANYSTIA